MKPRRDSWPQYAFERYNDQSVLQFTRIHKFCFALPRHTIRVIHRSKFVFEIINANHNACHQLSQIKFLNSWDNQKNLKISLMIFCETVHSVTQMVRAESREGALFESCTNKMYYAQIAGLLRYPNKALTREHATNWIHQEWRCACHKTR